jgi:electron transfer flavoprotein alpha subunit
MFAKAVFKRNFATLVLAEHFEGKLNPNLGALLTAAAQMKDPQIDVLVHGADCSSQIDAVKKYSGISKILVASDKGLQQSYGDSVARVVRQVVTSHNYDKVIAASSGFGKDVMPRAGALLDVQAITDVIEIVGDKFKRPVYAGNAIATVSTSDKIKMVTVRATNFAKVEPGSDNAYQTEDVKVDLTKVKGQWVKNEASLSESADLSSAKFVVSGGRGLKNGENFKLLYEFAAALGASDCAVGASRAAVDAGYVANDL